MNNESDAGQNAIHNTRRQGPTIRERECAMGGWVGHTLIEENFFARFVFSDRIENDQSTTRFVVDICYFRIRRESTGGRNTITNLQILLAVQ